MNKITFLKLLDLITNVNKDAETLENLGIDISECSLIVGMCEMFDTIIEEEYGQEGLDWVQWWIYEKASNPDLKSFETNEEGEQVEIVRNVDELYDYLEKKIN